MRAGLPDRMVSRRRRARRGGSPPPASGGTRHRPRRPHPRSPRRPAPRRQRPVPASAGPTPAWWRRSPAGGTPASPRRAGSRAHSWGRYSSRSRKARPWLLAYPRNTPIWQFSMRPAVPLYWRCTPTDLVPFFRKPVSSTIKHAGRIAQVLGHVRPQVIAHRVDVPVRRVQQPLHPLRPRLAQVFGQLPAVLALDPIQQPRQIPLRPLPRFGPAEAPRDPAVQRIQSRRASPRSPRSSSWSPSASSAEGDPVYPLTVAVVLSRTTKILD